MALINKLIEALIVLLDTLLPALGVSDSFFQQADAAFAFFITLLQGAAYILPLDVMVTCLGIMFLVDNFSLFMNIGLFLLKLIRG